MADNILIARKLWILLPLLVIMSNCTDSSDYRPACSLNYSDQCDKKLNSSYHAFQYKSWFENQTNDYSFKNEYFHDFIASKKKSLDYGKDLEKPKWHSLGPFEIGGRSLCLAIHPRDTQKLWMGSAGSGLWESSTGGLGTQAWSYVATGFPVQSVSSIALDPNNPNHIYIGTGENYSLEKPGGGIHTRTFRGSRGIGLLKSEDGGKSWKLLLDHLDRPDLCIWKILIPKNQSDIIYLAGNMGILKSVNKGQNWFSVFDTCIVTDMLIQADNPNILYAGVGGIQGNKYGLYKSLNAGLNWKKIDSPAGDFLDGRIMLCANKGNPQMILAAYASAFGSKGILRSPDGFESTKYYTTIKDVCAHQGWYAKCLHIKDDDPQKLLMGGVDLYFDSSGTGNKFINLIYQKVKIHADFHDVISNPLDANKIYFATDGGLYRTNDFGKTAFACNQGFLSSQFYNGSLHPVNSKILGGLQDNKSVLYENDNWTNIHFGDGTFNAFHPYKDQCYFISSQFQNLYQSENAGKDWQELLPPNKNAAFVAPFELSGLDPDLIYSGGDSFLTTNDGGRNWHTTSLETTSEKIVSIYSSLHSQFEVLLSSYSPSDKQSRIYVSHDKGNTLEPSLSEFHNVFIRDITGHPQIPTRYYAAASAFGQGGLLVSVDRGIHWNYTQNLGLPKIPCHSILVDPLHPETIYLGTDLGLYVSFDEGQNWESYNTHTFDVAPVYDIKFDYHFEKLIIFTHGLGAFSCERVAKNIPTKSKDYEISKLHIHFNEHYVTALDAPVNTRMHIYNVHGREIPYVRKSNHLFLLNQEPGIYILYNSLSDRWNKKIFLF